MASYASTVTNTPESHVGSLMPASVASVSSVPGAVDDGDLLSLEEREARLAAMLQESELAHAELSERMLDVYEKQGEKLTMLRIMEKTLSSQAGSLLKRLQSEEQSTSSLSSIIKRYKSEHKKLLAKIANPKWEIAHHYHMTCIEHQLGHRQPHVLDVAELLPGHLRIYSLARVSSLYKRALMYYSAKSKADRNSVSESIQESYKRLREVRKEMKEIQRMMDMIKAHMKKQSQEQADRDGSAAAVARRIPKIERQDSGERTFDPTTPNAVGESPLAAATAAGGDNFATPSTATNSTSASSSSSAAAGAHLTAGAGGPRRPGSAGGGPGPIGNGAGGPGGMDAMMRQRRRMLGMGGPGQSGGPGRSSGPGVSGRSAPPVGMGLGTPVSGTTSAGETKPSSDPLAPLNPDAIVLPTEGAAFTPLATTLTSPSSAAAAASSSSSSQSNYRMKYFKTLNLAPKLDFLSSHLPSTSPAEARKDMQESYNMDMKGIHGLLSSLEATGKASKEKAQQLTMLQQYRKRMGVESLPQPHFDAASTPGGLGALDAPQSPMAGGLAAAEMSDSDNEGFDGFDGSLTPRRSGGIGGALRGRGSPSASPRLSTAEEDGKAPPMHEFQLDGAPPAASSSRPSSAAAASHSAAAAPAAAAASSLQSANLSSAPSSRGASPQRATGSPSASASSPAREQTPPQQQRPSQPQQQPQPSSSSSAASSSSPSSISGASPDRPASFGQSSSRPVSKPISIPSAEEQQRADSLEAAERARKREQRKLERSKPTAASPASAQPVTLFSSRGAKGASLPSAGGAPGAGGGAGGSESQPAAHGHASDRPRAHSSRAISSRGLATNRADEHGR